MLKYFTKSVYHLYSYIQVGNALYTYRTTINIFN